MVWVCAICCIPKMKQEYYLVHHWHRKALKVLVVMLMKFHQYKFVCVNIQVPALLPGWVIQKYLNQFSSGSSGFDADMLISSDLEPKCSGVHIITKIAA